jgi:hypothetical protein
MTTRHIVVALSVSWVAAACGDVNGALHRLAEARQRTADLQVSFANAVDASNRAVMADTDEASVKYAQEADAAKQAVRGDITALHALFDQLGYSDENRIVHEFEDHFTAYAKVDTQILELAVENTNLKAQRLSFGPGQAAADALRDSLAALAPAQAARDDWRLKATAATALAAVREIQALQAPHIADPDDASMAKTEARMKEAETIARNAAAALAPLVGSSSRPMVAAATDALDRFMDVNAQVVALSHRNTNVRSLALALNEKPTLVAPCDQTLRTLADALAHRGYPKGRWD